MIFKNILTMSMNECKMRLETKIVKFFNVLETQDITISKHTNRYLIKEYYNFIGFNDESSMNDWFRGLASNKYPVYSATEQAVKRARNYELRWRRDFK